MNAVNQLPVAKYWVEIDASPPPELRMTITIPMRMLRHAADRATTLGNTSPVAIPDTAYQVMAMLGGEYSRRTGGRLIAVGISGDDVLLERPAREDVLVAVAMAVPGVTYIPSPARPRLRVRRVQTRLWFRAFIPKDVVGTTETLLRGPYAGQSAVRVPLTNRCFLTDQRGFAATVSVLKT